jgi:hypothetical protein
VLKIARPVVARIATLDLQWPRESGQQRLERYQPPPRAPEASAATRSRRDRLGTELAWLCALRNRCPLSAVNLAIFTIGEGFDDGDKSEHKGKSHGGTQIESLTGCESE